MKHTHNGLNRILSILLICVMISQTCFSVYSADLGGVAENKMADTTAAENSSSAESQSEADAAEATEQDADAGQQEAAAEKNTDINSENETADPDSSAEAADPKTDEADTSDEISMTEDQEETQPEDSAFSDSSAADPQSGAASDDAGTDDTSKLVLGESELKSVDLSADTEYSGIELGDGSTLSVDTKGYQFTVNGDITGKGKLILKGKNIKVQNISVSELVFDEANVDASSETDSSKENSNKIVAADSLKVQTSEIHNAAFLGYDENATGYRTLTFDGTGNNLFNIGLVGTYQDANVNVWISGVSKISTTTNTSFCYDNKITYQYQDNEITAASNWPVSYRTTYSDNTANATVTGYHTFGTEEAPGNFEAVAEDGVLLPAYAEDGYVYQGWMIDESQDVVTSLPQKLTGDITLHASMTASELTVTTDLGYEPSADTNDDYKNLNKEVSQSATWGDSIELSTPSRFGYEFAGWKVIKEGADTQSTYTGSYTASMEDATQTESGSYAIRLEAQWTAKSFPFRFFIKDADVDKLQVKVGGQTYDSVSAFAANYENVTWNPQTSQLELPDIQYGELLSAYLTRIGVKEVPVLVDTRDAQSKKEFEGWTTPGGNLLTEEIAFVLGGILDNKPGSVTLAVYETSIRSTPLFLTSIWQDASYKLTVKNAAGWEILVNNNVQTLDASGNAELDVQVESKITFRYSVKSSKNFSRWNFSDNFLPEETKYSSGAAYISYIATMPHHDVTATYSDGADFYIDIAQSSITFAEDVSLPSGRTVDGFWYDQKMTATTSSDGSMNVNAMTPAFRAEDSDAEHAEKYFYIWDFKDDFPVTSCNEKTQNQLTMVDSMSVVLKNCKLAATEAYKNAAQDRKLNDIVLEGTDAATLQSSLATLDLRQYGNIILDVKTHDKYTTLIKTEGENAVGVIVQSRFDGSTAYNGTLNVKGTTGKATDKLTVSGTLLNETLNFDSVTLLQDENVSSNYLLYCSATNEGIGNINFSGCDIKAPNKRIHTYRGSLTFKKSGAAESSMEIGGVRTYGASNFYSKTYVRCRGDWIGAYNTLSLSEHSSIVIDGNLVPTYSHWTAGVLLNTTGYLIVKGNRADLENLTMLSGTLIANAAVIGRSCSITGGTLIANQIMNSPAEYAVVDTDGNYQYTDKGSCEPLVAKTQDQQIDDDYPFKTYSQNNSKKGEFLFGGTSEIYLLGYYKTSDRVYDTSVTAMAEGNPVAGVLGKVLTADGNLETTASLSGKELQNMVKESSNTENECVVLGNSTYNTAAKMRSVNVSGAKIYAAGNMTFFNDTEITSGTVYCNGRLSGKRDLTIGGTARVTATEVGNNYNLTTEDESGLTRWQKLTVNGGTITTDRLGAASTSYGSDNSVVSRSTLDISGNPTLQAKSEGGQISYTTDVYINYLADTKTFKIPDNLPFSVRYEGNDYQKLSMDSAVSLQSPTLIADAGTKANWVLDSLSGESVDTINTDASFSFEATKLEDKNAYKERDKICFYAVKGTYDISIAEGADKIEKIQVGDVVNTGFGTDSSISAVRGTEVTVTLNDISMAGKSVIWYQDAAGKVYNVKPTEETLNNQTTLKFIMPAASVQIYVTGEMKLYLNRYEISITKDGFRTQYDAEASGKNESSFTYAGDLVITQDNIKGTAFVEKKGNERSVGVNGILKDQESATGESLVGATKNRLHIESVNEDRSVTLNKIIMDGAQDEDKIIVEKNCGNVSLQIDGAVRVLSVYLQTGSELIWTGKNQKSAGESDQDILQFDSGSSSTANITGFIHNGTKEQTGNVTFEDLNILRSNEYYAAGGSTRRPLIYSPSQKTSAVVTFKDCNMKATVESSMTLVSNYPEVKIDNCNFDITASTGWNSVFLNNCSKVTIEGGSFSYTCGASYDAFPLYYSVKDFCIDGAKVSLNNINSGKDTCRMLQPENMLPDTFTVKNAGELKVDHRIKLKKLTLSSDGDAVPKVYVGENKAGAYEGSLLCKDITVEKGEIHTGRLLISGYYNAPGTNEDYQSKTEILAQLRAENNLTKDGTLVLKDGIIEAAEEIGGALGGTITVEGGQITSPKIGSCDRLYGYGKYLPTAEENEWIYSISRIPEQFTLKVNGGTINVSADGYLGGMNTAVTVSDGKVNLLGNAILGMTEEQKKQLSDHYSSSGDDIAGHRDTNCLITVSGGSIEKESTDSASGSICAPYGSVKISGAATKIKVSNLQSEYGNIEIKETQDSYVNPYTGSENSQYKKNKIGIWVTDTLSAQTVSISEGAQVYANKASAVIDNGEGSLSVSGAALYSEAYGETGVSRTDNDKNYNDKPNDSDQTVFGTHMVSVTYVLNPKGVLSDEDQKTVTNSSPTSYVVTSSDEKTSLVDAECKGYNFLGWYTDQECSVNKAEELNTTIGNDVTLYAKWEKIKVKFQVMMDGSSTNAYKEEEFTDNTNWKKQGESYVSTRTVELSYGDHILGSDSVNLGAYTTNTLGVTDLEIEEENYTGSKTIDAATIVSKDLAEFYKAKAAEDSNAVITLHVKQVQKRFAVITFNVNKKGGKPVDAAFEDGSVSLSANVGVDTKLGDTKFGNAEIGDIAAEDDKSAGLAKPTATGYTFIGWNTDASATKGTEDGWVTAKNIFKNDTTVYAIWQANTYLIEFDAGEGSWVTSTNAAPEKDDSEVKTLSYYWIYDTPISEKHSFWLKGVSDGQYMTELPYAWRNGFVFDHDNGWTYSYEDKDGNTVKEVVTSTEELSKRAIKSLDISADNPSGEPIGTALTLTANYTPVTVTYNLNNGKWSSTDSGDKVTPAYGTALAGYVKGAESSDSSQNDGESSNNTFRKLAQMTGENGSQYYVKDTSASYFTGHNNQYVDNDYRNSLTRKGYTFYGWYKTQEAADAAISDNDANANKAASVGTAPRFSNVELYAAWKPNNYNLKIKNKDANITYSYTTFGVPNSTDTTGSAVAESEAILVTTGKEISSTNWPSRDSKDAWYVQDKNGNADTTKRYFLGATFAALDPGAKTGDKAGTAIYDDYVKTLSRLEEKKLLYWNKVNDGLEGTVFNLPDNDSYSSVITGTEGTDTNTYTVPDYPADSDITMYALYREQSLVFVERYVDKNGKVQENIKHTTDWSSWSDYAENYSNQSLNLAGYTLVGWYVNQTDANEASRYPDNASAYKDSLESYKAAAAKNGTYDIMVYTVYATEIKRDVQFNAQSDPTSNISPTNTYRLPGSMQKGVLSMVLSDMTEGQGLQLISKEDMQEHAYDSKWTKGTTTYTSDTAVAIEITVAGNGKSVTQNLSERSNGTLGFDGLEIGAGDQITLTLYHSRVMTKKSSYSFDLEIRFTKDVNGKNTLENQKIKNNITVNLTPSVYIVNYSMNLPESLDKLTIQKTDGQEDWGDFAKPESDSQDAKTITKQVKAGYGSDLLLKFPKVEGYTQDDGWKVTEDTDAGSTLYKKLTMKVSAANNGVINLSSGYTVQTYRLSADANVLNHWKITYSDGPDNGTDGTELTSGSTKKSATVKYHSVIRFEPKDSTNTDPAEFVTLTLSKNDSVSSTKKLPDYAKEENGTYTFTMPAQDITGTYQTEETLYLDDGTISITANGYTQTRTDKTVNKIWRGNYKILQNAKDDASTATANTLILANDLSERNILLGNLNISSDNSIELKTESDEGSASTKAVLAMNADNTTITAKNIQVPSDCELTVKGAVAEGTNTISNILNLNPDTTNAAVGGTSSAAANGTITLQNLNMNLSMQVGSVASGIGPADRNTTGTGNIKLDNCNITVAEESSTDVYKGVWVGGNNVENVTINNVSLNAGNEKHMAGPAITAGQTVNINNSEIGTKDNAVSDPVYAVGTLNIKESEIYMNIQDNLTNQAVNVPIGTVNGTTTIEKSVIKVGRFSQGAFSDIYSGIMKIQDADSNVMIDGTQVVEVSNGSMTLDGIVYKQENTNHEADASRKNYRLLEEGTIPATVPDLTVESLVDGGHVEIQQPLSAGRTAVGVGKLEIQNNTYFILNGNLEVNGNAVIQTKTGIFSNDDSPFTVKVRVNPSADGSVYGILFKSDTAVFKGTNGSTYEQYNGTLSSASDFGDGSLNVTLNNVVTKVPNLYADTLNIYGGSVTATATAGETQSKVGSIPAKNGVSTVTIRNASVTADVIGALGEYDKTFTSVTTEEKATFNGTLVQDHYRLDYDIGKANGLDTTSLKHTVRTETKMSADSSTEPVVSVYPTDGNGIPVAPTEIDSNLFGCWYININGGSKKALASKTDTLPAGLNARTTLSGSTLDTAKKDDVTENKDGTKTLKVHAWLKATGTVTIQKGRVFQSFSNGATSVSVQSNGAWTAQLISTGTFIEDRDYQVSFGSPLPKGSTLTLTEPATENAAGKYYWYKVEADNISSVKFTEFTAMGGTETDKFHSVTQTENIPENETFLLSVDFPKTSESDADNSQNVTFKLLPSVTEGTKDAVSMGETVTYTLTPVSQGEVSVSDQNAKVVTVDQLPQDADQLTGKKLFMKAVIRSKDSAENSTASKAVPHNATAKWNGIDGTWISRDTVLFEIGQYGSVTSNLSGEYSFTGLKNGTYQISWSLVYGETATGNIAGNTVSNEAVSEYTEAHTDPSLKVTTNAASRVIPAGTEAAFTFECETASANVIVTVEKQDNLCTFSKVVIADQDSTVKVDTTTNNQAKVTFGEKAEPGTYRICFSTDTNSTNDNVYFTFLIK